MPPELTWRRQRDFFTLRHAYPVGAPATVKRGWMSGLFQSDSIDLPLVFDVFSFVISAGQLTRLRARSGREFNLLKLATLRFGKSLNLVKIIRIVGGNS